MSPFITLLTAIKKFLAFKVDRDEFRDVVKETKKDIEGIKNDIEDVVEEVEANKTHWSNGLKETVLLEVQDIEVHGICEFSEGINIELGKTYVVTLNGTEYKCASWFHEGAGLTFIGNAGAFGEKDSGEPFVTDGHTMMIAGEGIYTIKIATVAEDIHYLDNKYIKDMYGDTRGYEDSVATFQGNSLDGKDTVRFDDYSGYVKLSNDVYPYDKLDELIGKNYSYYEEGSKYTETITSGMIYGYSDFAYWVEDVLVVLQDTEVDGYYYSKGVWSYYSLGDYGNLEFYVTSFPVKLHTSGKLTQIDPKYLPDSINQGLLYLEYELSYIMERVSELENKIGDIESGVKNLSDNYFIVANYSPSSYFSYNSSGELTGLTDEGKGVSEIVIPPVIDGISITTIGDSAFFKCDNLTSVVIPVGITHIGEYAFRACTSLTNVIIGDSVTSIGGYAFWGCTSLTSITIPDSINSMGDGTFRDCTSLTNVVIGDSVTSVENYTFYNCDSLTDITIGDSVTSIGNYTFYNCTSLTDITIGDSVTSIGNQAFRKCRSLYSINIPDSVTSIGNNAFQECTSLTDVTISSGVTTISEYMFQGCTSLSSITIPDSVTSIGSSAFLNCPKLSNVVIPDSVTSIGNNAFRLCKNLTTVILGDSVDSIDYHAFSECAELTSIVIPKSVTSIGDYAFYMCMKLSTVYYTGTEEEWRNIDYDSFDTYLVRATKVYNYVPAE